VNNQEFKVEPERLIMTVHDVARYLRLSESKVYRSARAGVLPAIRIGKTWRFNKELIDEWFRKEAGREGKNTL
jgi:excisionase family DNA binding protein